jgi:hypothetical protein
MTYRIELIPKDSTIADIIDNWINSGRKDNSGDGQFVFEDCDSCNTHDGALWIAAKGKQYVYNLADFYRVKIIDTTQPELF